LFGFNFARLRTFGAGLVGLFLGVLISAFLVAGDLYDYTDTLVGGRGRILTAFDLWVRYLKQSQEQKISPPFLYFSGVAPQTTWATLSGQLHSDLKDWTRPEYVILENLSPNTVSNAEVLVQEIQARGWKKILLVTSSYHMKRSIFILKRILHQKGVNLEIETATHFQEPFDRLKWRSSLLGIQVTLLEFFKFLYYRWTLD
jgi:hypothetical protein